MIQVVSAEPLPDYRLKVAFNDGLKGEFAVDPEQLGGVFLKLLEPGIFNAVSIDPEFGCVQWPGEIDLCPTMMHDRIAAEQRQTSTSQL
jgi:hypothetical protein